MQVLKILAEIVSTSEKYEILRDAYLEYLKENSTYRSEARNLIITKLPDKKTDLELDLIEFAQSSDSEVKKLVGEELEQLV